MDGTRLGFIAIVGAVLIGLVGPASVGEAHAWQAVAGRVTATDGVGLADVEIRAQMVAPAAALAGLANPQPFVVGRTDRDGNFRVDLPREANPVAWERVGAVVLLFARDGLRSHAEHLVRSRLSRPVAIRLESVSGGPGLDESRRPRLQAARSTGGPTVFLLPFALRGPTPKAGEEVAEQARVAFGRMIRRHLTGFTLATPLPELVVRNLDLAALELDDAVAPAALIEPLDALAVMGGRFETGAVRGRIVVVSEFALRGASARLPMTFRAEDSISAEPAAALAELERLVAPRWARLSVLVLAASELGKAAATSDALRLRAVQQIVAQELRRTGRGHADFLPQALALQQEAEAALRRLGQR